MTAAELIAAEREEWGTEPSNTDLFLSWGKCLDWLNKDHPNGAQVVEFMRETRSQLKLDFTDVMEMMLEKYMVQAERTLLAKTCLDLALKTSDQDIGTLSEFRSLMGECLSLMGD